MITSIQQAWEVQTRRAQQGKRGIAKAVRRFFLRSPTCETAPGNYSWDLYRHNIIQLPVVGYYTDKVGLKGVQ